MLLKKWFVSFCIWISKQLKLLSKFLVDFFFIFQISPLTIISLLALYYIVWISDQGQDLIITINNNARNGVITQNIVDRLGPISLYLAISILAVMNWYFPKFFYAKNLERRKTKDIFTIAFNYSLHGYAIKDGPPPNHLVIPRLFGILTFFIPAFGMLKALNIFGIQYLFSFISPGLLLIIFTLIVLQMLDKGLFVGFHKNHRKVFNAVAISLFCFPILFGISNRSNPLDLTYLFFGLLFYGILFAMVTANRSAISRKIRFLRDENISLSIWIVVGMPVILFAIYFICNIFLWRGFNVTFLTLAIVLSGIITYYALFTILNFTGKINKINFSLILVILLALVAKYHSNEFHFVKKVPFTKHPITLENYIGKWLQDRYKTPTDSNDIYPIYIVNTYGGGVRAAAWICFSISELDSIQMTINSQTFQEHVLAYSGASGGTIGASILCANGFSHKRPDSFAEYKKFYSNDFLTPLLTGLIGNDIWYACLGFKKSHDRSVVQESTWERFYGNSFHSDVLADKFDSLWSLNDTHVPLLFSNSTDIMKGRKGIYAPVSLNQKDFQGSTLIQGLLGPKYTLKLSTAAFLSARFPFLSPAAGFDSADHFMDGGAVENSGSETAMQVYRVLKRVIDSSKNENYHKYFRVRMISLKNTWKRDDTVVARQENFSQIFGPISGAINVGVYGNTVKADSFNYYYFTNKSDPLVDGYFRLSPIVDLVPIKNTNKKCIVPLPLGWSISEIALVRMKLSLDSLAKSGLLNQILNRKSVVRNR